MGLQSVINVVPRTLVALNKCALSSVRLHVMVPAGHGYDRHYAMTEVIGQLKLAIRTNQLTQIQ